MDIAEGTAIAGAWDTVVAERSEDGEARSVGGSFDRILQLEVSVLANAAVEARPPTAALLRQG